MKKEKDAFYVEYRDDRGVQCGFWCLAGSKKEAADQCRSTMQASDIIAVLSEDEYDETFIGQEDSDEW